MAPVKQECLRCHKSLDEVRGFYKYDGPYSREGRMPICKDCVMGIYDFYYESCEDMRVAIHATCCELGLAFKEVYFKQAQTELTKSDKLHPFAAYMKFLSSNGSRIEGSLSFRDSDPLYTDIQLPTGVNPNFVEQRDPEMIAKWGPEYTDDQYAQLEDLWNRYSDANNISTPQEQENLKIICMLTLKYKSIIMTGDESAIQKMSIALDKALTAGKLRPMDQTSSNDAAGIRSFSDIYAEVEKRGYIKPEPVKEFKDIVDRAIMHIINYTLKLMNKPTVTSSPVDLEVEEDENGLV